MAKYTTEVRTICESYSELTASVGYSQIEKVIEKSKEKIFDFDFPIFDESYRSVIETKILKHFYTREIGLETVGLWKLKLNVKMNEIMPYYNQLYKSALLEFNPLYDVDVTRKHEGANTGDKNSVETNGETSGVSEAYSDNENTEKSSKGTNNGSVSNTSENNTNHLDKYSDTPQGSVSDLTNGTYLTNAREITDNESSNTDSKSSNDSQLNENEVRKNNRESKRTVNRNLTGEKKESLKNTEQYLETVKGKQGTESYSKLLQEYRETFINIDMLVIGELSDLFMNLW